MLINNLRKEYSECVEKNNGEHFSNPNELTEYFADQGKINFKGEKI